MRMVVSCGGTGGHVFPGVEVAKASRNRGHAVSLWLAGRDVERASAVGWAGESYCINVLNLSSAGLWGRVSGAARMVAAIGACRTKLRRERPEVLIAMGSYASVAPVLAARSLGIPVVLHEANAVPGRAVSFLAPLARTVAVGFEEASQHLPRAVWTGFPVRPGLVGSADSSRMFPPGGFTVLVMGGSQGARRLNEMAPAALGLLLERGVPVQAIHLSGRAGEEDVRKAYEQRRIPHRVFGFLQEMGTAYGAADLAVARSGAGTCAELAVFGVPALLVPLPTAMRDHQTANARVLERAGAAEVLVQADLTPELLAERIEGLWKDRARVEQMRRSLRRMAAPDAADRIVDLLERSAQSGT